MKINISPKLKDLPCIDYRMINELQGNLKDLYDVNFDRLKKSLEQFGFIVPLYIWFQGDEPYFIDGHQRGRVLNKIGIQPYKLPYVEIEAETLQEAKQKLLVISSQYGTITREGYDEFTFDIIDEWKDTTVHFDGIFDYPLDEEPKEEKAPRTKASETIECPHCGETFEKD